jgi:hypothetical protein
MVEGPYGMKKAIIAALLSAFVAGISAGCSWIGQHTVGAVVNKAIKNGQDMQKQFKEQQAKEPSFTVHPINWDTNSLSQRLNGPSDASQ